MDKVKNPGVPETNAEETVQPEEELLEADTVEEATAETNTEAAPEQEFSVEQWQAALETAVAQRDDLKDKLLRSQADFQNFKRRNATSRADGYRDGVCEVLEAMLPALDNLDRALAAADEKDPLAEGVRMTLKALFDSMGKFGLEEVPSLGEEFDPELHNAVMQEPGDEPGKITAVFQKGYRAKDKIIRYAMVKVAT